MNKLYKTLVYDRQVSLSVLETTDLVNKAIRIHGLQPAAAKLFGSLLTCGAYMAGCLKSDRGAVSLTVKAADGDGAVSVSADRDLHVRGYVDGSCTRSLEGGTLTVVKDDGFFRPFVGTCAIGTDDVSEILMQYYHQSEQIPTAVAVGVKLGADGSCLCAGGVVMQLLPGTTQENMDRAEEKMQNFVAVTERLEALGADGIIGELFRGEIGEKELYLYHPDYICNCSRAKFSSILMAMGKSELEDVLREQGKVSVHCHYCNTDYDFSAQDVENLFAPKHEK